MLRATKGKVLPARLCPIAKVVDVGIGRGGRPRIGILAHEGMGLIDLHRAAIVQHAFDTAQVTAGIGGRLVHGGKWSAVEACSIEPSS